MQVVFETTLNLIEVAALLLLFVFCFIFLLVHVDNYTKSWIFIGKERENGLETLDYGKEGEESLLDLYLIEFKDRLQEETLREARYWLFIVICLICLGTIARSRLFYPLDIPFRTYLERNEAHDELHHFALLRRYFHAIALQDLRRYRADAEYEHIAIQIFLAARHSK